MKEQQLEKRGGKETDPEVAKQKMERAQLAYAEKEAGCKQIEQKARSPSPAPEKAWWSLVQTDSTAFEWFPRRYPAAGGRARAL